MGCGTSSLGGSSPEPSSPISGSGSTPGSASVSGSSGFVRTAVADSKLDVFFSFGVSSFSPRFSSLCVCVCVHVCVWGGAPVWF